MPRSLAGVFARALSMEAKPYDILTLTHQGKRATQEDRYVTKRLSRSNMTLNGIFDGHGGDGVATLCRAEMPALIDQAIATHASADIPKALHLAHSLMDAKCDAMPDVGSTSSLAIVDDNQKRMVFANCGDSMALIVYLDGSHRLMSQEHKVQNELERIQKAGGLVCYQYDGQPRLLNSLILSRAIGDHGYHPWVIPDPHVEVVEATECDRVFAIVNATDGLWDVLTPEEVAGIVNKYSRIYQRRTCLKQLVGAAITKGTRDNTTVSLIYPNRHKADPTT